MQNALSFLACLAEYQKTNQLKYIITCNRNSAIEQYCKENNLNFHSIAEGKLGRIKYELYYGAHLAKKNRTTTIFSIFGGPPLISSNARKISGFAYSNIIQPEINFWGFLPWHKKILKKTIDKVRLHLAHQADELILETDYLAKRAKFGVFKEKTLHVVKMAPSAMVSKSINETLKNNNSQPRKTIDILYLSGAHENKRIHELASIFSELNRSQNLYRLITTLPENSKYYSTVKRAFEESGSPFSLKNIGPIPPENVGQLLTNVDGMINTALLESFSNNWVEAWLAEIPLITTDADWSRDACGNAAIYIDIKNPTGSASMISATFNSKATLEKSKIQGKDQLKKLLTPTQKFHSYMTIINNPHVQPRANKQ